MPVLAPLLSHDGRGVTSIVDIGIRGIGTVLHREKLRYSHL